MTWIKSIESELKPCPFCGCRVSLEHGVMDYGYEQPYVIICNNYNCILARANNEFYKADEQDIAKIWNRRVGNPWIKVEDRLPETSSLVLCCNKNHGKFLAFYKDGRWNDVFGLQRDPTHWMPMPEGPWEQTFAEKLAADQIDTPDDIAELITKNFKDLI